MLCMWVLDYNYYFIFYTYGFSGLLLDAVTSVYFSVLYNDASADELVYVSAAFLLKHLLIINGITHSSSCNINI